MFIVATEYIMTNSKGRMNIQSYVQDMQQVLPWLADHLELNSVPALAVTQLVVQMLQP